MAAGAGGPPTSPSLVAPGTDSWTAVKSARAGTVEVEVMDVVVVAVEVSVLVSVIVFVSFVSVTYLVEVALLRSVI